MLPAPSLQRNQSLVLGRSKPSTSISKPSANENILCVAKVIHRHIYVRDGSGDEKESEVFNIDNYAPTTYKVSMPTGARALGGWSMFKQTPKAKTLPRPDVSTIHTFIQRVFDKARLNAECAIIALIYTERIMETAGIYLTQRNWIPIVLSSLLTASKVWDDLSSWNIEFSEIFPVFPLKVINQLERDFLGCLQYNLYISGSLYAKYYFSLRALRQVANPRGIPQRYLQVPRGAAAAGAAAGAVGTSPSSGTPVKGMARASGGGKGSQSKPKPKHKVPKRIGKGGGMELDTVMSL